jgi:hypothetical protein
MAQTKTPTAQETFEPYIAPGTRLTEFTLRAVIIGAILGMIFGASSLYLVLKTGLTVSASIPVAVISIALFRTFSKLGGRDATILENNIVQTAGSAGESIAFGVGVTMPAILILGFQLEVGRVILVSILGGLLGILMMIPLRRALIVQQHGTLKYPEGTACAEVLKAGASEDSRRAASAGHRASALGKVASVGATTIFTGFGVGIAYNVAMKAFRAWKDTPEKVFDAPLKGGSISCEITPELLGIGYVIGPRIAAIMCAGGVLSYLLLIPLIKFFGEGLAGPLAPGTVPIKDMSPNAIRGAYILYIGAGAVAAGGLISLVRSIPLIWHGIKEGLRDFGGTAASRASVPRTDRDLPMKFVFFGIAALILAITPALAEPPKPTIVAQAKPVARLMGDFREMVRQTAGPDFADKALKEFDNGLKELLGEQGFEGLDINRPMGTYVVVRDDIQDTSAFVVVPITGEKEFIGLLGRMKLKTEAVKDKPGTYTLQLPEHIVFPKASMVHIVGAWAHVSLNAGDAVDAKDLIPPETLIDNADPALITAKLYPDRVPDKLVKTTLDQMDQAAAMVKGFVGGAGAPPNWAKLAATFFEDGPKLVRRYVETARKEASELAVRITWEPAAGDNIFEFALLPRAGTALAKDIAATTVTNRFAGLIPKDAAAGAIVKAPLFAEEIRNIVATLLEAGQVELKNEEHKFPKEYHPIVDEVAKSLIGSVECHCFGDLFYQTPLCAIRQWKIQHL